MVKKIRRDYLKIAVVGGGNGGKAMAAYLGVLSRYYEETNQSPKLEVRFWNRTPSKMHPHVVAAERKGLDGGLIGLLLREENMSAIFRHPIVPDLDIIKSYSQDVPDDMVPHEYASDDLMLIESHVDTATSDLEEAVSNADLIMVVLPSTAHEEILTALAPYVGNEKGKKQYVVLNPGRTFGALLADNIFNSKSAYPDNVVPAEAATFIYASRNVGYDSNIILGAKNKVDVAAIPNSETSDMVAMINEVYDQFIGPRKGCLYTSADNMGSIFHAGVMIAGAQVVMDRILLNKSKGIQISTKYYQELATNPIVSSIIDSLDRERLEIFKKLGISVPSAREWLKESYGAEGLTLREALKNTNAYDGIIMPNTFDHRYLTEDFGQSLYPLYELGIKLGVETPTMDLLINLARIYQKPIGIDLFSNLRTLESLGIDKLSGDEIKNALIYGLSTQAS